MTSVRQAAAEISPRREVDGVLTTQTPLNELIDAWWVLKQKSGLKVSTLQKIKENLTLLVRPQVGSWPIGDATAMRLDQVIQKTLENKGVLPARSMRSNLNQVLALAVRWGLLDQNPIPRPHLSVSHAERLRPCPLLRLGSSVRSFVVRLGRTGLTATCSKPRLLM